MSEDPPPWFDKQSSDTDDRSAKRRKAALLEELPKLLARQKERGRANSFYPYLLIRSVLGDRGDRPINVPFWESPDIWTAPGEPAAAPAVPPDHGGTVTAGKPNTVYAHVWNLGFAPLAGIRVEFYWFDPSAGINGSHANLIGTARCELAARGMPGSHKLVKCTKAWVPVMKNGGHECLVARASGIGDPLGANEWAPWANRHVGQRNISVVMAGVEVSNLIGALNKVHMFGTRLQLIQVGPKEGELVRHLAVPNLRLSNLSTHVLGEINMVGDIVNVEPERLPAGMLAPVHALAAGGAPIPPTIATSGTVRVVHPAVVLRNIDRAAPPRPPPTVPPVTPRTTAPPAAARNVGDLMKAIAHLHQGAEPEPPPARGEAQVLRLATYSGDQLVGGYTLVVTGS